MQDLMQSDRWRSIVAAEFWDLFCREGLVELPDESEFVIRHLKGARVITWPDEWSDVINAARFIADHFGIGDRRAWLQLWGFASELDDIDWHIAEQLRYAQLIDFIAVRLTPHRVGQISLLGRTCESATAYRLIQTVARDVGLRASRFRPDDRIDGVVPYEKLSDFWNQLRWRSGRGIPGLRPSRFHRYITILIVSISITSLVSSLVPVLFFPVLFPQLLAIVGCVIARDDLRTTASRLPCGYQSFRDIALAARQTVIQ